MVSGLAGSGLPALSGASQFVRAQYGVNQAGHAAKPVPLADGLLVVAVGVTFFALVETEKQMRLRLRAARPGE